MYIDNKSKDILIVCEGPTQEVDNTTLAAEAKYPINYAQSVKRFVISLHYNEIKYYALCLDNISKDSTINNMEKNQLKEIVKFFSVDFNPIDGTKDILDIYKYLVRGT